MKSDFYLDFENKFRGNRQDIIEKLSIYDPLVNLFINNNNNISSLDIGCGRGEWLQRWRKQIPNASGIEKDKNMINLCKKSGLNIIEGDAIDVLSIIEDNSISIITIFHMIEHIETEKLTILIEECYRVLKEDGILIIETPSIDNLIVSSKLFYIDSTHINQINPDRIIFDLECAGFAEAHYYYINGGPLESSHPLKLTRVLNGVAQDLAIVACKNDATSNYIFKNKLGWQLSLAQAPSTLEAATSFDYKLEDLLYKQIELINTQKCMKNSLSKQLDLLKDMEKSLSKQGQLLKSQKRVMYEQSEIINDDHKFINMQNQEIVLFKEKIRILEDKQLTLYKILSPLINTLRLFRKLIIYVFTFIFSLMINYRLTRRFLNSKYSLSLMKVILQNLPFRLLNISYEKVYAALNKVQQIDIKSVKFNHTLLMHYNNSITVEKVHKILLKRVLKK